MLEMQENSKEKCSFHVPFLDLKGKRCLETFRADDMQKCSILDWTLEEKKDISGKTGEMQLYQHQFLHESTMLMQGGNISGKWVKGIQELSELFPNFPVKLKLVFKNSHF